MVVACEGYEVEDDEGRDDVAKHARRLVHLSGGKVVTNVTIVVIAGRPVGR